MPDTLLRTKLFVPPLRLNLVSRSRLVERLNEGLQFGHKLTLISAPAGFGKTTLVTEWLDYLCSDSVKEGKVGLRISWLSLDEGDNDLSRFLAYLVAALNQIEGIETTIGKGALDLLQSPQSPPTEAVLTSLINDVTTIPENIILVLDDYHTIESSPVDETLTFFLEHLPPNMHLVIATRDDPQLPLARLRARGQLAELRAADLRFTTSEVTQFLNQVMSLELSAENIVALESRTEGWIAGLQLAAISMQGHQDASGFIESFTGSHHFVLDYLIEDVLSQQSVSVQTFLLQTSILRRMTGSLCNAVTGQENGRRILGRLEHANLFIVPLDDERRWYRYHHLFSDLLRQRLHQTQPDRVLTLHHRASKWYEQNGIVDEAIKHTLRAEDFERAASLIEVHFDAIFQRGEHSKLRCWLAALPVELVFSKPQISLLHAWSLFASGQLDAAERSLQAVEKMLEVESDHAVELSSMEGDHLSDTDRLELRGRAAAIRAFLASYRGDVPGTIRYSRQALDYLPEKDLTWRSTAAIALGDAYDIKGEMAAAYQTRLDAMATGKAAGDIFLSMLANLKVAVTLRQQGRLQRVIEICQQQQQLADERGVSQTVMAGWLLAIWGEVLAELNDLDGAVDKAMKGVELAERGKDVAMIGWSNLCLVRVLFSRGDLTGTAEIIQKMENLAQDQGIPPWVMNPMTAWQVRIWLAQDRLIAASQKMAERGIDLNEDPKYLREMEYMVMARILIAQGRSDETTRLLKGLLEMAEAGEHISRVVEILILQALAYQAEGETTQAMTRLERALAIAKPAGFVRTFVDEGPAMAQLLYKAVARGMATNYTRRLLAAFPITEPGPTVAPRSTGLESELVEPLSERELEVLQLIAEGLTNREIASRLYLSLNTVKAHTRNIYGKLAVHNRRQAVDRARTLGILTIT